jgi:uncharacterized membrane protein YbhN (UPF0104 family)
MRDLIRPHSSRASRASVLATVLATGAVIAVAATPHLLGARLRLAFAGLGNLQPIWVCFAGLAFLCSLLAMASAWSAALAACGARIGRRETCARYGIGSLVNTVAPLRLGDAVRVALFARALERQDRIWAAGGALAAIEVGRVYCIAILVTVAWGIGALPLWPALVLVAVVGTAVVIAALAPRHHRLNTRLIGLLAAISGLMRSPKRAAWLLGSVAIATTTRVAAAVSICAALNIRAPLVAGLLIVAALDLSGQIPLTPGSLGITSGTVAVALASRGIGLDEALTAGIALQAVETAAGLILGTAAVLQLATIKHATLRRWTPRIFGVLAGTALIAITTVNVFSDLS